MYEVVVKPVDVIDQDRKRLLGWKSDPKRGFCIWNRRAFFWDVLGGVGAGRGSSSFTSVKLKFSLFMNKKKKPMEPMRNTGWKSRGSSSLHFLENKQGLRMEEPVVGAPEGGDEFGETFWQLRATGPSCQQVHLH